MMNAGFFLQHQISQQDWDNFVSTSPQSSIYAQSWYLNTIMPGWNAVIVSEGGKWQAVLPFRICRKFGIDYAKQPLFSQYLGVLFAPIPGKTSHVLHQKRKILEAVIAALPENIRVFSYNFSPEFDYFLPFIRHGFEVKPLVTLHLSLLEPAEEIIANCSTSVLNHVKKAQKNGLMCFESGSIATLKNRLEQSHLIRPETGTTLELLWENASKMNKGFLLEIKSADGSIHSSGLFIVNQTTALFLASATDRSMRHLGSNSMLIVEAIKKCKQLGINKLDFKGSMIKGVEQFLLGFNPKQQLYLNISKNRLGSIPNLVYKMMGSASL